jgi:hypothetical protein
MEFHRRVGEGLGAKDANAMARTLAQRMAKPTGVSGWFQRLITPKWRSIENLAWSLAVMSLARLPPAMDPALRHDIAARIGALLMSIAFLMLDERGRSRWRKRTQDKRGAFAKALRRVQARNSSSSRGPAPWLGEKDRVTLAILRAMEEEGRPKPAPGPATKD